MKLHKVVYGTLSFLFGVSSVGFFTLARLGDDALADFGTDDE